MGERKSVADAAKSNERPLRLGDVAHARSGDKGSSANVGVIAYTPAGFEYLKKNLTVERVAEYFAPLGPERTVRYELPGLGALNFMLHGVLAGGGSRSLRVDAQGKALGQAILEMPLHADEPPTAACFPSAEDRL